MSSRPVKLIVTVAVCAFSLVLTQVAMAQGGPAGRGPRQMPASSEVLSAPPDAGPVKKKFDPSVKPPYANYYMQTNIGSFRMLEYNDDNQPEGRLEMTFTGTVLVDTDKAYKHSRGLSTSIEVSGNVRKEVDFHGRVLYHGTGKIVVSGGWHALEFFGTNMNAKFNGYGVFRLSGEFDKDLNTGYYWYDNGKKYDWGTAGAQPTVPAPQMGGPKPTIKFAGKAGKS